MDKSVIGILFILAGITYGSLIIDSFYNHTLGWLVENKWINPAVAEKVQPGALGRKTTILLYGITLIFIGIFILWNRNL